MLQCASVFQIIALNFLDGKILAQRSKSKEFCVTGRAQFMNQQHHVSEQDETVGLGQFTEHAVLADSLARLAESRSPEQLRSRINLEAARFEIDAWFYGYWQKNAAKVTAHFALFTLPEETTRQFLAFSHESADPMLVHAKRRLTPFLWLPSSMSATDDFQPRRVLLPENTVTGLQSAMVAPIHDAKTLSAVLVFARRRPFSASHAALLRNVMPSIATHAHESGLKFRQVARVVQHELISEQEAEALRLTAQGLTTIELAEVMEIRERTVLYYLQNAVKKLGAHNRTQAVVRALELGIIAHE
jgi:DNA-binding CsgD family transcriptional regulator